MRQAEANANAVKDIVGIAQERQVESDLRLKHAADDADRFRQLRKSKAEALANLIRGTDIDQKAMREAILSVR